MRPILLRFGSIELPSFFLMITIGALLGTFFGAYLAKKEGRQEVAMLDFGIIGMTAGVFGAKLFHVIFENPTFYLEHPLRIFYIWQGGLVSVGALISIIVGLLIYLKIKKLERWPYLDLVALTSGPIIIFFTRVGCLLAGCCFGKPTDLWWGIKFPITATVSRIYPSAHIHPTQIYFQINAIIMFVVLFIIYKKRKFYGQITAAFLMYYGLTRFFIEFLRSSHERVLYFGFFPAAHLVMTGLFLGGLLIWIFRRKHRINDE